MSQVSIISNVPLKTWHNCTPLKHISGGWRKVKRILDYHTDAISSIGILVVTTGVLAAKIFPGMPKIIGNSGRLFLEFAGIIWFNVQIKEFSKSRSDCVRAIVNFEYDAVLKTVVKVMIKGINILLTCAYFCASITTFGGFPSYSKAIYMTLRPLSLAIFSTEIVTEICDYMTNRKLLKKLDAIENQENAGRRLLKIMCCYLRITLEKGKRGVRNDEIEMNDRKLSSCIVRQLDTFTISMIRENVALHSCDTDPRMKAWGLYYNIKDGLINTQARVKSNLSLTVLAYLSRGICKMYPDSLTEMIARWSMSVLFTDELVIKYKLRQMDLIHL